MKIQTTIKNQALRIKEYEKKFNEQEEELEKQRPTIKDL